jgi:hypothetical protein
VFVLNMTYDIGVKQISFHLALMSLLLLAPDFAGWRTFSFWTSRRPLRAAPTVSFKRKPTASRLSFRFCSVCIWWN